MTHVCTIIILMPDGPNVQVSIFTTDLLTGKSIPGYWCIDNNRVLLSPAMYQEFKQISGDQRQQRKFFDGLLKISSRSIPG